MNDFNLNNGPLKPKLNTSLLVVGIGIIFLGCLLALDSLTIVTFGFRVIRLWPIIIAALGIVKLVESKWRDLSGWIITAAGVLLLVHSVYGYSLKRLIWPAILIIVGIFIVLSAIKRNRRVPPDLQKSVDFTEGTAILSAYSQKPSGGLFNGGAITAIFGGFDLDLRRTTMKHESARIDVFILFGGGEIIIPEDWEVSVHASAIGGAVDNKRASLPVTEAPRPKLLITGTVLFGGVEVK
jgi:predicted membrane protein